MKGKMAKNSGGVSAITRCFALLEVFDVESPVLSLTQISNRSGVPMSTAHRLVEILVQTGILVRQTRGRYSLGLKLWEIGARTSVAQIMREIALPFLHQVQARINQHTQLGVLADEEVIFLERLSAPNSVINYTMVGGRLPLNASSSGLLLLATRPSDEQGLLLSKSDRIFHRYTDRTPISEQDIRRHIERARKNGFVVAKGWIHPDATGIAVAIRDTLGDVGATLSVVVPNDGSPTEPIVQLLQNAASRISSGMRSSESYALDKKSISQLASRVTMVH